MESWISWSPSSDESSIASCVFRILLAGVKNRAVDGVNRGGGRVCDAVGRGVEEKVKRGVELNWVLGRGVFSCASGVLRTGGRSFLITNRCGEGVTGGGGIMGASCREAEDEDGRVGKVVDRDRKAELLTAHSIPFFHSSTRFTQHQQQTSAYDIITRKHTTCGVSRVSSRWAC